VSAPGCRILIVDDDAPTRFGLEKYLEARGMQVEAVGCPDEARRRLSRRAYDVVLLDLRLTADDDLEGLELVARARRCSRSLRILVVSAYCSEPLASRLRDLGANCYLQKPRPLFEIADRVERLLALAPAAEARRQA
jgi:DNA-binding response OmpR family regulator